MYLLHYDLIAEFQKQFYGELLLESDITEEIHMAKLTLPDGGEDKEANFWGFLIEKFGKKFLLSEYNEFQQKRDIKGIFPLRPITTEKVSHKGKVYYLIQDLESFSIRREQSMSFRDLLHVFTSASSSNPGHQTLLWLLAFTQMFGRANFRVATNPGFGKDSVVDIMGNLIGGAGTIENPTIAKLEERASILKWLAVNEVVGVSKAQWKDVEMFLLAAGAHKPRITKRSRAYGTVGEEIDISQFSISLLYNDITDYPDTEEKYLDFATKKAVLDRFVPFRLHGRLTENFTAKLPNVTAFINGEKDTYVKLIRAFLFYKENYQELLHGYSRAKLMKLPERWLLNVNKLLEVVDLYSETQEEFDAWVHTINQSIQDYKDMLKYPRLLERLEKKAGPGGIDKHKLAMYDLRTFTQKNEYILSILENRPAANYTQLQKFDEELL